jgi:hypothetical protein
VNRFDEHAAQSLRPADFEALIPSLRHAAAAAGRGVALPVLEAMGWR